jgi:thioredoxin 1
MDVTTETQLKSAVSSGVTLVDFAASWCDPCKQLSKELEILATLAPEVAVAKVDVDEAPELAQLYAVMSVPTILVFSEGELKGRLVGSRGARTLLAEIRQLC